MNSTNRRIRVLYSFPHKLGADRICYTAWQQVNGLAAAGADVVVFAGAVQKAVASNVRVRPTLAGGGIRIPYKLLGSMRAFALHDWIVSRRIQKMARDIDIIHTWPLGALETLRTAACLGIPTVLERPNAHTRFAMAVVQKECERLGVTLPRQHEHAYNIEKLHKEEQEYQLASRLLCPSEFVVKTFLAEGFVKHKLARHIYGFDENVYYPSSEPRNYDRGLRALFVGLCTVRKGAHYALEAWLNSPASENGTLLIAGEFLPAYAAKLAPMLSHPSVRVLGYRKDVPELMRASDILILPSIEEGSALVTSEARGCGCVLVVSEAAGASCIHMKDALVHQPGDVETLRHHITILHENRSFLDELRSASLRTAEHITWNAAGVKLLQVYAETIAQSRSTADVSATIRAGAPNC